MSESLIAEAMTSWRDPASVYAILSAGSEHVFWLDAGPDAEAGWSWVGAGAVENDHDLIRSVVCAASGEEPDWRAGRFRGGWVGWIGYDRAAGRAGAPFSADADVPEERWIRADRFVAFDHRRHIAWIVASAAGMAAFADLVSGPIDAAPPTDDRDPAAEPPPVVAEGRQDPLRYAESIAQCRAFIREGDAYQLCLTTRFSVTASVDPDAAHRRLRALTPAHHGGIVRSGDVALISASPERFLEVERGAVRTRPIKGTRPRGDDAETDAALARELSASEKERAENVMIVDLMRNDLSRVCEPASVAVDDLLVVESYPAVHQLVSTVSGSLRPGTEVGELLEATFPAGSMTGAPKLSAMTILHALEGGPRGIYSGCYGWVGRDGAMDLAMVIRSIVTHPGGAYVGAGGGITWRSDAAAEVAEVGIKARGPLGAIGATLPDGW